MQVLRVGREDCAAPEDDDAIGPDAGHRRDVIAWRGLCLLGSGCETGSREEGI